VIRLLLLLLLLLLSIGISGGGVVRGRRALHHVLVGAVGGHHDQVLLPVGVARVHVYALPTVRHGRVESIVTDVAYVGADALQGVAVRIGYVQEL
jgi:hypothetical protein